MPFSEELRSSEETAKRTGVDYVKFTPKYRTVLRVLDPKARTVWKHFIQQANQGRGNSAVCPNVSASIKVCPIEESVSHLPKDDKERRDAVARRRFIVNVLDRTPYTICNSCQQPTPAVLAPSRARQCVNCGGNLKDHDFKPLNKVKILESGPQLFNSQLNAIEQMQLDEAGADITQYDITFTTSGEGRDRTITAIPQDVKPLEDDALIDDTGEPQKLWDLDLLTEPTSVEIITLMLQGATNEQILAVKGIA